MVYQFSKVKQHIKKKSEEIKIIKLCKPNSRAISV